MVVWKLKSSKRSTCSWSKISTNSVKVHRVSFEHFRLLTTVWHFENSSCPQFDNGLQAIFNFMLLLTFAIFTSSHLTSSLELCLFSVIVGKSKLIQVYVHCNNGWYIICGFYPLLCLRMFWLIFVRRCQDTRNVSLAKEKWQKHPCNAMLHQTKPPLA